MHAIKHGRICKSSASHELFGADAKMQCDDAMLPTSLDIDPNEYFMDDTNAMYWETPHQQECTSSTSYWLSTQCAALLTRSFSRRVSAMFFLHKHM